MQEGDYFRLILPHEYTLDEMAQSVQDVVFDLEDAGIYVETPNAPAPKSEKRTTSIPVKEERSEERRVGKECRARGLPEHEKNKDIKAGEKGQGHEKQAELETIG